MIYAILTRGRLSARGYDYACTATIGDLVVSLEGSRDPEHAFTRKLVKAGIPDGPVTFTKEDGTPRSSFKSFTKAARVTIRESDDDATGFSRSPYRPLPAHLTGGEPGEPQDF